MGGKGKKGKKGKKSKQPFPEELKDRHVLYAAAVQEPVADIRFMERIFRRRCKRLPVRIREDFCGTAYLSSAWAAKRARNEVWGVDLDQPTLAWGREQYLSRLGKAASRVHLICDDVLTAETPTVDVAILLNFSYFVFKERQTMLTYFSRLYESLAKDGVVIMDICGGSTCPDYCRETRWIREGKTPDGKAIPPFKVTWEHEFFNSVNNGLLCHLHFKLPDGTEMFRAFTYDWRLWSAVELREILEDVGFKKTEVYAHGWNADGTSDDVYRLRTRIINEDGWLGYVVGYK